MDTQLTTEEAKTLLKNINIPIIDEDVNYWFIRTNGGENFESFYFGNYVAIGWDKFNSIKSIEGMEHETLKNKIEEYYPYDTKPGSTASQIIRFVVNMKIGDYIMIPGANCDRIAFGKIKSNAYIYELTEQDKINALFGESEIGYLKRRNVEWITDVPFDRYELDPMLIPIIYSYGTIVDANPYSTFINRTIYDLYYQNNSLHSVFDITKNDSISVLDFNNFINNIFFALDEYVDISKYDINKEELSIKASFNSPGPVEIITAATSAFIFLAGLTLFLNGAKVKFTYNIFNCASGDIDMDAPGLIDKIRNFQVDSTNNEIKLQECSDRLLESKEKLKIKKKKKKK